MPVWSEVPALNTYSETARRQITTLWKSLCILATCWKIGPSDWAVFERKIFLKTGHFSYVKGMKSAFLELDCLNILLLLLLLVAIAFDVVEYRRALTYVYSLPETLAHIYE